MDSSRTNHVDAPDGIDPAAPLRDVTNRPGAAPNGIQFRDVLRKSQQAGTAEPLTFSAHAQARLRSRNIQFSPGELDRINKAVDKIAEKGGREALLLVKSSATQQTGLVVSVKNRVVITAVDEASMRENVFTNIDSAIII